MSSSPEEGAGAPQVAAEDAPSPPAQASDVPPRNLLLYTVFGFLCIGIALWLVLASLGYKEKYSQRTEAWQLGGTRMLEITLIRNDKQNLACASEKTFDGLHCGFHSNSRPWGTHPQADPQTLQPFNTVRNELFLAAGLWQSPILKDTLPQERFTVVCNYHVAGVLRAVSLRWSATGTFSPADQSVTVGKLTDCTIPQ